MPNQHKTRLLGWNPTSAEDGDWARDEAERRGVPLKVLLDEMLSRYRAWCEGAKANSAGAKTSPAPPLVAAGARQPQPARRHALTCKCGTCRPK